MKGTEVGGDRFKLFVFWPKISVITSDCICAFFSHVSSPFEMQCMCDNQGLEHRDFAARRGRIVMASGCAMYYLQLHMYLYF